MTGLLIVLCDVLEVVGVLGIVAGLLLLITTSLDPREDHR